MKYQKFAINLCLPFFSTVAALFALSAIARQDFREAKELLNNSETYKTMSMAHNPYGSGKSARQIVDVLYERKSW